MEKIRGVWLTNVDSEVLDSKKKIAEAMNLLEDTGFNTVFPVVWNKGYTLYRSGVLKTEFGQEIDPNPKYAGRDPLAEVIEAAHAKKLKVIPWFEFGFAASFEANGGHIIAKKPNWSAKDQNGDLLKKNGFEWMNALSSEVQDFLERLILEVVNNYPVEGIQGDDRLPAMPSEGGYDADTVSRYKAKFGKEPPKNTKDELWLQWRADILTNFLADLTSKVKTIRKELIISMAPSPYPFGFNEYLQDVPNWIKRDLVDILHPQLYRTGLNDYNQLLDDTVDRFTQKKLSKVFPGILAKEGNFLIDTDDCWQVIKKNRNAGIRGEVLFFHEALTLNSNELANFLKKKKYAEFLILRRGHFGADVEELQNLLIQKGFYKGRTDSDFGALTESAVEAFQASVGLSVDGIVGSATYAELLK
ncbi:hypothetical protein APA_4244 [Pseudanabaena sp. lw0831]|uniref:family 10 glycosylhydrolase n=1 Tax=Pseudanabaena sp. lw0831 TaxID=1357935 RepID=UPI00191595E9|nr:family 10 glycosylhydrolase [Pseudanabaena sp. lw0831]GBO56038.1 hypothetical protein APA_4244 [Pseudanabaena sp. lw0831]